DKYRREIEQCQKEIEAEKVKHSTIEPCYNNYNKQVVDLNEGLANSNGLAEVLKQERDSLLKYKNEIGPFYKEKINALEKDLNKYQKEIESCYKEKINTLNNDLNRYQKEIEPSYKEKINALNDVLDRSQKEIEPLREEINALSNELNRHKNEIEPFYKEINQI